MVRTWTVPNDIHWFHTVWEYLRMNEFIDMWSEFILIWYDFIPIWNEFIHECDSFLGNEEA